MSLPALSLGDWFNVSRKGGTGIGGLVYTLKRVKTAGLCVGLAVKLLSRVIVQMVLENSHPTSQGLHAVFKYDLLAYGWLSLPKQLDHKCARVIKCNRTCSLEQENHLYRVSECRASVLSMHSIHSPGKYIYR